MSKTVAEITSHLVTLTNPCMNDNDKISLAMSVSTIQHEPDTATETIGRIISENGVTVRGAERIASYLARLIPVDSVKLRGRPRNAFTALFKKYCEEF